ncbi:MAG TPA: hypothetical protein VFW65_05315 [Pseudonocardiaceae bacterium]|nr:hypothetical protein [Pseudonocardiaceae bacterium]
MSSARTRRLIETAGQHMGAGEQVQLTTMAKLGSAPVAANAGVVVAASIVGAALGGGWGFAGMVRKEVYVVLTDRQLMFFQARRDTGAPGKHLASFQRAGVTCSDASSSGLGLFVNVRITAEGLDRPVRLQFPPIPARLRKEGRELAAALPRAVVGS